MRKTLILLFLMPALAFADELYLKGGGSFSGRITEEKETMVLIDTGDGIVGIPRERIERIVKGRSPLDDYEERARRLKPNDVDGWRNLGRWASQQGISTQSREAYQKVLAVAPNDAEAREALGFVLVDGRWLTEEESYRARGYVKYDGEWMTPAEAQMAQSSAAAEEARREAEQRATDAEVKALEAEARAEEDRKRAEEAEERSRYYSSYSYPTYWGGWGYGVTSWPTTGGAVKVWKR